MNWQKIAAAVLLILGVGITLLCCVGMLAMRDAISRLHYLGPASSLGAGLIAAAVIVDQPTLATAVKAILIVVVMGVGGPVVTSATARAFYLSKDRPSEQREQA